MAKYYHAVSPTPVMSTGATDGIHLEAIGIPVYGRYYGFWEFGLKPWDIAAGILLVREAGGYVTEPAAATRC